MNKTILPTQEEKQILLDRLMREVNDSSPLRPIKEINNAHYIIALVVIILAMTGGVILTLSLRPDIDPLIVFASVPIIGAPTILGLLTLMNSRESKINSKEAALQTRDTHKMVNSNLRLWMDAAEKISFAAGLQEGMQLGTASANERTDTLAQTVIPTVLPTTPATIPVEIVAAKTTLPVEIVEKKEDKK